MADHDVLTNAFLASHPEDAARVLEQLPDEDAAALYERAPARLGAPVLGAMLPYTAARCLLRIEASRAAMLLAAISVPAAVAVLRYLTEAQRAPLFEALPTATAIACRALLAFPRDSVGAYVDTEILALPPNCQARDALETLRAAHIMPLGPVYVIDARRRPLGQVGLPMLMRAGAHERLDTLMSAIRATLPAATPLAGADGHPAWREADLVPVVERGGGLVGVAQLRTLRSAQRRLANAGPAPESLAAVLAIGYWHTVAGLVEATLSSLAASPRDPS